MPIAPGSTDGRALLCCIGRGAEVDGVQAYKLGGILRTGSHLFKVRRG